MSQSTEGFKDVLAVRKYYKAKELFNEWIEKGTYEMPEKFDKKDDQTAMYYPVIKEKGYPVYESGTPVLVLENHKFVGTEVNSFDKKQEKLDYIFEDSNGGQHILNQTGNLAWKMSKVPEQSQCQVTYLGLQKIEKGASAGIWAHQWSVKFKEPNNSAVEPTPIVEETTTDVPF